MNDVKKYWRSLEEYNGMNTQDPVNDNAEPKKEFPAEDLGPDVISDKPSRRDFLKLMGFTIGYAALANSCEMPVRKAIPYLSQPEEITPGIANFYASTFFDGLDYCSILVKTREGRPIKIEGNALSTLTQGGTNARVQASVLSLYDMARLKEPLKDSQDASWQAIDQEVGEKLKGRRNGMMPGSDGEHPGDARDKGSRHGASQNEEDQGQEPIDEPVWEAASHRSRRVPGARWCETPGCPLAELLDRRPATPDLAGPLPSPPHPTRPATRPGPCRGWPSK